MIKGNSMRRRKQRSIKVFSYTIPLSKLRFDISLYTRETEVCAEFWFFDSLGSADFCGPYFSRIIHNSRLLEMILMKIILKLLKNASGYSNI